MRILDFSDGFTSATEPTAGSIQASGLKTYASDAAFVSAEGTAADGDIYYNTTADTIRAYINGAWVVVAPVSGGGGGASLVWSDGAQAPVVEYLSSGLETYVFSAGDAQFRFAPFLVPSSYTAGSPIALRTTVYSPENSGNILFQTVATLIRTGTDAITSTTNQRTSTNSAISLSAGTVNEPQSVVCDLSSASGQINGVSISAGDLILIKFQRGTDTATGGAYWVPYGAEITTS